MNDEAGGEALLEGHLPGWAGLADDQRADIAAHVRGLNPGAATYSLDRPPRNWRCFHCGEVFRTEDGARLHFGSGSDTAAGCLDGSAWRPIDDAPKDGQPIVGISAKGHLSRCWWQPEFNAWISSAREMKLVSGLTFDDGSSRRLHSPEIEVPVLWTLVPSLARRGAQDG